MVLLTDTNVILDYLMVRKPQYDDAVQLITSCQKFRIKNYMAFHSVSIIWYILKKNRRSDCRRIVSDAVKLFSVTSASHEEVVNAINFSG